MGAEEEEEQPMHKTYTAHLSASTPAIVRFRPCESYRPRGPHSEPRHLFACPDNRLEVRSRPYHHQHQTILHHPFSMTLISHLPVRSARDQVFRPKPRIRKSCSDGRQVVDVSDNSASLSVPGMDDATVTLGQGEEMRGVPVRMGIRVEVACQ